MDSIKRLTELFSKFPTVGPRTASRFVFYLINAKKETLDELGVAIEDIKNNVKLCSFCFNPFEGVENVCVICKDLSRNKQLLCVVEKENDLMSIEATKQYKGLYFILGGVITLKKTAEDLRFKQLQERIGNPEKFGMSGAVFSEIIIAINPTPEGKATTVLVERTLKELPQFANLKITHLAQGLPVGGELEYADPETLESAFEGRK
jgi:recombination protein RecR